MLRFYSFKILWLFINSHSFTHITISLSEKESESRNVKCMHYQHSCYKYLTKKDFQTCFYIRIKVVYPREIFVVWSVWAMYLKSANSPIYHFFKNTNNIIFSCNSKIYFFKIEVYFNFDLNFKFLLNIYALGFLKQVVVIFKHSQLKHAHSQKNVMLLDWFTQSIFTFLTIPT